MPQSSTIDVSEFIPELHITFSISEMQKATLQFKLTLEAASDDFMETFYGLGYIFTTILGGHGIDKEHFLNTAEVIAGTASGVDSVWLSYRGWYIIADGTSTIRLTEIDHSDFEPAGSMSARLLYENNFAFREKVEKKNQARAMMS